ncbi:MAG: alpha/beta hydrolase [Clostridiales bacterium]|jgi:pimeloyl-ACP methyl ester carboxylesterase|nr:alpha/beta hydrolase [Clostridiales bacterium]MDR2749345.1 alpha/beta hydrolase [Clostridiales bacterium]
METVGKEAVIESGTSKAAKEAEERLYGYYGLKWHDHYVSVGGLDLRVTEIGTGDPILVIPGGTGEAFPLAPLFAELAGKSIFAVNLPGSGLSGSMDYRRHDFHTLAIDVITSVLDTLHLDGATLMGHSIGAHWCLWFAIDHPDKVGRLILLGAPGHVDAAQPPLALRLMSVPYVNRAMRMSSIIGGKDQALSALKFMGHSQETLGLLPSAMSHCFYQFAKLPGSELSAISMLETTNRLFGKRPEIFIGRADLVRVRAPSLLLWGTRDPFGSSEVGFEIAKAMKECRFREIRRGGHFPWLENPVECGELILEFDRKN